MAPSTSQSNSPYSACLDLIVNQIVYAAHNLAIEDVEPLSVEHADCVSELLLDLSLSLSMMFNLPADHLHNAVCARLADWIQMQEQMKAAAHAH